MTDGTEPEPTRESLLQANQELRTELDELKEQIEAERKAVRRVGWFGLKVFVGGDLRRSFRAWMNAKSAQDPMPNDETADLAASLVRRLVRVSLVGLAVAVLPTALLVWQNWEIRRQSELFREQLDQQVQDTRIVRRAQLLATIYDCAEPSSLPERPPGIPELLFPVEPTPKICPPRAHRRARVEAVQALAEIDGAHLDLSKANLSDLDLSRSRLSGAIFHEANFRRTYLRRVDFSEADLFEADLKETVLLFSDLIGASLERADLRGASLTGLDLSGTDFRNADLRGARFTAVDLSEALYLTQAQIDSAQGNARTKLPEGLTHPEHWLEPKPKQD